MMKRICTYLNHDFVLQAMTASDITTGRFIASAALHQQLLLLLRETRFYIVVLLVRLAVSTLNPQPVTES